MSNATRWLLLGLKGVGKTSYLAALWHQLEAGEIPTVVTADHLQPDRTYLNRIRDAWLALKEVPRTSLRAEQTVELRLCTPESRIDVSFPDPSGEGLSQLWASRRASASFVNEAREATGLLLFVHPKSIRGAERIPPVLENPKGPEVAGDADDARWKPESVPTQVQLVDLMQLVDDLRLDHARLPVSVVVSAWDLVKDSLSPEDWVRRRLPLLWQYLSNSSTLHLAYFGVSATGGDLNEDRTRLADIRTAAERVLVQEAVLPAARDLTLPLSHLLSDGS